MNKRTLSLASAGLFGVLVLGLPAQAFEEPDQMIVVRDAETGQLRAPTAAEAAALQGARLKGAPAHATADSRKPLLKRHASGAVGTRISDEAASYAVVSRRTDGTLEAACIESRDAADQAVRSGIQPAPQQRQTVEK